MSQVAQSSGLELWASRIRNELASATGMAEFTERVQIRGFDWMSSFVNSVLHDEYVVLYLIMCDLHSCWFLGR